MFSNLLSRISQCNHPQDTPLKTEYEKIRELFCDTEVFRAKDRKCYTYFEMLNIYFFYWNLKGSSMSAEEMIENLHVSDKDFAFDISKNKNKDISENRLLHYIQFIINALAFIEGIVGYPYTQHYEDIIGKTIKEHCRYLLNRLNADARIIQSEWCVYYKNDVASAVSAEQPDLKASVIDYRKIVNRDNYKQKYEILCSLAKDIEKHKEKLNAGVFKQLYNDTTFILNKAGIRHAFNPNDKQMTYFQNMGESDRIKWCDRAFEMILACMAWLPYLEYKNEIEAIKKIK